MSGLQQRWPAETIWEQVAPLLPGFTVEVLPEIDSTNAELMRRVRQGLIEPVLLVAERQSAGRGRRGRSWASPAGGGSLAFSVALPLAPADWLGLSLTVGVAVAEGLDQAGARGVQLKWPNDLLLQGRKLGGILIETANHGATRVAVMGVGLNLDVPDAAGWPGTALRPAGLRSVAPGMDAPAALLAVAGGLVRAVKAFEGLGFAPFHARYAARDALQGQEVDVQVQPGLPGPQDWQGVASGVDVQGALCVRTALGDRRVMSAEVSVRPLQAVRELS